MQNILPLLLKVHARIVGYNEVDLHQRLERGKSALRVKLTLNMDGRCQPSQIRPLRLDIDSIVWGYLVKLQRRPAMEVIFVEFHFELKERRLSDLHEANALYCYKPM